MSNVFETLKSRGFVKQVTHEGLAELLEKEKVAFYVGYDATADSLHVGHFVQLMVMAHMQRAGHIPIVLIGGGTTMVGDPSGKTDMRKMMTKEIIASNAEIFKKQISKFLDLSDGKGIMVDNADWLLDLNYVEFLREIGTCFSVNRMLTADCYKKRLEKGLTFFEFNYMLMQAYDFLVLNREYDCKLEVGGDDQWSNILAGADLIRRKEQKEAYGLTISLLLTSDGRKMGKTEAGALWLDGNKTSPYEFYQYFRNVADDDVKNCLSLLTFLPLEEVEALSALKDSEINKAKEVLAYEVTKQIHGQEEATKAQAAAKALFGGGAKEGSIPTTHITMAQLKENPRVADIMVLCGLAKSKGDARRLIAGGGVYVADVKITEEFAQISVENFTNGELIIKKGKKAYHQLVLNE